MLSVEWRAHPSLYVERGRSVCGLLPDFSIDYHGDADILVQRFTSDERCRKYYRVVVPWAGIFRWEIAAFQPRSVPRSAWCHQLML